MYLHAVKGLAHGILDLLLAMPEAIAADAVNVEDADGDGHDEEEGLTEEEGLEHDPGRFGVGVTRLLVLIQGDGHGVLVFVFT